MPDRIRPRQYRFIGGILSSGDGFINRWYQQAARWVERNTADDADYMAYGEGIIPIGDKGYVANLAALYRERAGDDIDEIWVGHSHGCQIILRTLVENPDIRPRALHLIAPACESSYHANGLNLIVARDQIAWGRVYASRNDEALKLAKLSCGMFGSMGLDGPADATTEAATRVRFWWDDRQSHSSWFSGEQWATTMTLVTQPEYEIEPTPEWPVNK